MKIRLLFICFAVILASSQGGGAPATFRESLELIKAESLTLKSRIPFKTERYFPLTPEGRQKLKSDIETLLALAKAQKKRPGALLGGDLKKGLKYCLQVLALLEAAPPEEREDLMWRLFSVTEAINNHFRPLLPTRIQLSEIIGLSHSAWGTRLGRSPYPPSHGPENPSLSRRATTFWKPPGTIAAKDLRIGFDRSELPDYAKTLFTYAGAKTGYGTHAGFRVTDENGTKYKIRIGTEASVAPFSSRIIWALGYNTLEIDYVPVLTVKYDRRLLTEYNRRKSLKIKLKAGPMPLYTYRTQKYRDPFLDIAAATLLDGTRIRGSELKTRLLKNPTSKAELTPGAYNEEFEKQMASLEFHGVSIEKINKNRHTVGPWDWNLQEHIQLRELRGYAFLAGWLGQFDARADNTRVTLVESEKNKFQLEHTLSDVGNGLGEASGLIRSHPDRPHAFPRRFIKRVDQGHGASTIQSVHFRTLVRNKTFAAMNEEDARWMLQLILQLSPRQLREALQVSGFSPREVDLFLTKLVARRDHASRVLGLSPGGP